MNNLEINNITFESIKHIDEYGNEYWEARELQEALQYTEWRKFEGVIDKAKIACEWGGYKALDHFGGAAKMVEIGSSTKEEKCCSCSNLFCCADKKNGTYWKRLL